MSAQLLNKDGSFIKDLEEGCFFYAIVEVFQVTSLIILFYQEDSHGEILCLEEKSKDTYILSLKDFSEIIDDWIEEFFEDIQASYEEFSSNITVDIGDYHEVISLELLFSHYNNPKNKILKEIKRIIADYI